MKYLVVALLLTACTDPFIPEGTARIDPPPEYRVWWEASRACVDKPEWVPFDRVMWFVSPERFPGDDGEDHGALTRGTSVYLWVAYQRTPWVIQHELVHAINRLGNDHPADPFVDCGLMPFQHRGEAL